MRAFLRNMILRPSCYACRAKEGRSHSDITIADFWGIQDVLPEMDDDLGTGLVLINTVKGQRVIGSISMTSLPVAIKDAIKNNPSWGKSVNPHPRRNDFFRRLKKGKRVIHLIEWELNPPLSLYQKIRAYLSRVKQRMTTLNGGIS